MTALSVNKHSSCPCGKTNFDVKGKPILRFFCHCEICQSIYKEPFADVTVFWTGAIILPKDISVNYKKFRSPPALKRAICESCNAPLFGFMWLAPFLQLEFVTTRNFSDKNDLPSPEARIFYHRRVADVDDALPKYSGYIESELAITRMIMKNTFRSKDE